MPLRTSKLKGAVPWRASFARFEIPGKFILLRVWSKRQNYWECQQLVLIYGLAHVFRLSCFFFVVN